MTGDGENQGSVLCFGTTDWFREEVPHVVIALIRPALMLGSLRFRDALHR